MPNQGGDDAVKGSNKRIVAEEKYVAWCDVMGGGPAMERTYHQAVTKVFSFHAIAASLISEDIKLHSMSDGFFAVAEKLQSLTIFLIKLFQNVYEFNKGMCESKQEMDMSAAFLIRSSIAFGSVAVFSRQAKPFEDLLNFSEVQSQYLENVILGPPLSVAYRQESMAPPMGIYLDISVLQRAGHLNPSANHRSDLLLLGPYLRWHEESERPYDEVVVPYFDYQSRHAFELDFPRSKVQGCLDMAKEYFESKLI